MKVMDENALMALIDECLACFSLQPLRNAIKGRVLVDAAELERLQALERSIIRADRSGQKLQEGA